MAQYTFSYLRSEYDRIPIRLKADLDKAISESNADEETKALILNVCSAVEKAITDLSRYAQDQLRIT